MISSSTDSVSIEAQQPAAALAPDLDVELLALALVANALLACGGMRTGQVIGTTDRLGGEADDRPVHFQEIFATLYHNMGIDINKVTLPDLSGRPKFLVDTEHQPLPEVV